MDEKMNDNTNPNTLDQDLFKPAVDIIGQATMREAIKSSLLESKLSQDEKKELAKVMVKVFEKGASPHQAMGISENEMSIIYSYAYQLFNAGKFADARELFKVLYILNPKEDGLATALGVCFHKLKDYENALTYYMIAAGLDRFNPVPFFYAYDCYINMNEKYGAKLMLCNVIDRARDDINKYEKIGEKATALLEALDKQLENETETPKSS